MQANSLTITRCKKILANILAKPSWTVARVARAIDNAPEYVLRIQAGEQSFQVSDVELLARACKQFYAEIIFESFDREEMEKRAPGLYDMGLKEIERHRKFLKTDFRKPSKKRRSPTKAA
jgi:hypothetical protein